MPAQSVDTEVLVEKDSDNGLVVSSQAVDLEVFEPLEGVDPCRVVLGTHGHDPGARGPSHARRVVISSLIGNKKKQSTSNAMPKFITPCFFFFKLHNRLLYKKF